MPLAVESASARLTQELTKEVRDRGLVLWVDAEHQYGAEALGSVDTFRFEEAAVRLATIAALRGH
jgi:hypothetical protein